LIFNEIGYDPLEIESSNWGHYIINSFGLGNDIYVGIVSRVGKLTGTGKVVDDKVVFNRPQPMWNGGKNQPFMFATFLQNGLRQMETCGYRFLIII